ncbi:flagellar filament capping protein FliD [Tunturiibacter gelidoferens]|uniref:Flagellar hook-associated protein 2 n=2 Tax=Tunturiibacter gelidiferens TaxID=3069689 RepID=A0AAU7Z6K2_9BACT|nr:flagellar filament capping protein FliD [Edaphobacter lichenicola]MBB5339345.1 flagellar hook-associated protein 2 [Edaphobacter lichenicola]
MGTVGLSFGSATSGQGFDVASTVTQIQAASQAIETPWQNQLTALKAQDTVLSSLGTDLSTLSTSLQKLTDFEGVFAEKQGSSSNTDVLSLTSASSTAVAGSHTIVIGQLAQTSSDASTSISNANDTLSGSVTIQGHTFNVDSTDNDTTLASLSAAINSAGIGVSASVITDSSGSRLSIVSGTSGAAGQLTISGSLSGASSGNITFQTGENGQDANLTVDGVSITSSSNTVSNAIPGVTFQLLAPSTTPVQVQITDATTDIATAISSFVSAYNTVVGDINTQEQSGAGGTSSPLLGSPIIAQLQESITGSLFSGSASGSINNITQLGISVNNDGTLTLSADTLTSALNSNLADVTGFLQNSGSFGQTLATALNNAGTQAPSGAIYLAQQQNSSEETALNADITNENAILATQKTQLTNELNAANQILQSIPSQLNEVNSVFDSLTGFNPNTQA